MSDKKDDKKCRYNGHVSYCMRHGEGTYEYPGTNYKYEGEWNFGVKTKQGKFTLPGMFTYEGEFANGEITGYGTKKWCDGRVYTGYWLEGEMHGFGKFQNGNCTEIYEGNYCHNKKQGEGLLTIKGDVFKGGFENNAFNGSGIYLRENKYILETSFIKGIAQGSGTITWNKLATLETMFSNGLPINTGYFSSHDGTFMYNGKIKNCALEEVSTNIKVDVDTKKDRKRAALSTVSTSSAAVAAGGKKPPPAKDEPTYPLYCTGEEFVLVINTLSEIHDDKKGTMHGLTSPCEIKRKMSISLCPIDDPATGVLGAPVSLWLMKESLNDMSDAWSRFPGTVHRTTESKDVLTGVTCCSFKFAKDNLSDALIEPSEDEVGVRCFSLCKEEKDIQELSFDIPFSQLLTGPVNEISLLLDFRLEIWPILKQLQKHLTKKTRALRESNSRGSVRSMAASASTGRLRANTADSENGEMRSMRSSTSRASIALVEDTEVVCPPIDIPIMRIQSPNNPKVVFVLNLIIQSNDLSLTSLYDKINEITENKLALERQRVDELLAEQLRIEKLEAELLASQPPVTDAPPGKSGSIAALPVTKGSSVAAIGTSKGASAAPLPISKTTSVIPATTKLDAPSSMPSAVSNVLPGAVVARPASRAKQNVTVEQIPTVPIVPVDPVSYSTSVSWELRIENEPNELNPEKSNVVARWLDGNFNIISWHSLAVSLKNDSQQDAELIIDGNTKQRANLGNDNNSLTLISSWLGGAVTNKENISSDSTAISVSVTKPFTGYVKLFAHYNRYENE